MAKQTLRLLWIVLLFSLELPTRAQPQSPPASRPAAGAFTILLTNDDGYEAPGLRALVEALRPVAEIVVAAPAEEQSGKSHSVTAFEPIVVSEKKQPDGATWYAVRATPATAVRVALEALLPRRPDLVISGINRGENLGVVVYYSGTVGAAREAVIAGLPAIAVSMRGDDARDYAATAAFIRQLVQQLRTKRMLQPGFLLNVNAPAGERKGARVTRLSLRTSRERFDRRTTPRGQLYFWSDWKPVEDDEEDTDVWAFARGYIALTPLTLDATATGAMEPLRALPGAPTAAPSR